MKNTIRLGAGSGFWGDGIDPAMELLEGGKLDYMGFDFLAELTMALLQRQKLKNPQAGYVPDAVQYLSQMIPLAMSRGTSDITSSGTRNFERLISGVFRQRPMLKAISCSVTNCLSVRILRRRPPSPR